MSTQYLRSGQSLVLSVVSPSVLAGSRLLTVKDSTGAIVLGPVAPTSTTAQSATWAQSLAAGAYIGYVDGTVDGALFTQLPITIIVSGLVVNTTTVVPSPSGTYNPEGPAINFYCTAQDVFSSGIGIRWEELQTELDTYRVMVYPDSPDVPSLIANHFIPDVESEIDAHLQMTHKPTVVSQYLDGTGARSLQLPFYPVIALNKCAVYANPSTPIVQFIKPRFVQSLGILAGDSTDYSDADLLVNPETGEISIPSHTLTISGFPLWNYTFVRGVSNVLVSWEHGFASVSAVPQIFKRSAAQLVAVRVLEACGMIEYRGAASTKIGDSARVVGREKNLPYGDLIARMEKRAWSALSKWKRVN